MPLADDGYLQIVLCFHEILPSEAKAIKQCLHKYYLAIMGSVICDGYSLEWCTLLCATTPIFSS